MALGPHPEVRDGWCQPGQSQLQGSEHGAANQSESSTEQAGTDWHGGCALRTLRAVIPQVHGKAGHPQSVSVVGGFHSDMDTARLEETMEDVTGIYQEKPPIPGSTCL